MLNKSHHNVFHAIIQNQNDQLMAGLFQGVLKFKLTVTQTDVKNVYFGQITSLEDNQEMKEDFNSLEMVLVHLNQSKSVKLNKNKKDFPLENEVSLTLTHQVSNKLYQYVTVPLKLKDVCLEDIIERCHKGDGLRDNEIKKNFQVLSKQIVNLKQKNQNLFVHDSLLDCLLEQMNQKTQQIKRNHEKFVEEFQELNFSNFISQVKYLKEQQYVMQMKQNKTADQFNKFMEDIKYQNSIFIKQFDKQKQQWQNQKTDFKNQMLNLSKKLQMSKHFVHFINRREKEYEQKKKYQQELQLNELSFYKEQKNFPEFSFDGKRLMKKTNECLRQFVFFNQIPFEEEFKFKIKVIQQKEKFIMIGLIDYDKQKQFQYSFGSENALSQNASHCLQKPDQIQGGVQSQIDLIGGTGQIAQNLFLDLGQDSEENVVEVRVERKKKSMKWMVNGQERICLLSDMIGDKNRKLFPYVQMYDAGDTIEIDFE